RCRLAVLKQVDFHFGVVLDIAKNMAAGDDQRTARLAVHDRARTEADLSVDRRPDPDTGLHGIVGRSSDRVGGREFLIIGTGDWRWCLLAQELVEEAAWPVLVFLLLRRDDHRL